MNGLELSNMMIETNSSSLGIRELLLMQQMNGRKDFNVGTLVRHLHNLTRLTIDIYGEELIFDDNFKNLTNFRSIKITGTIHKITNTSFENLPELRDLELYYLTEIKYFSVNAFAPLVCLENLSITFVRLGLQKIMATFLPLAGKNMSSIYLERVQLTTNEKYTSMMTKDGIITAYTTRYLRQICLREITMTDCSILMVTYNAFKGDTLGECLVSADMTRNPIFGTGLAFLVIANMKKIETLFLGDYEKSQTSVDTLAFDVLPPIRRSWGERFKEPDSPSEINRNYENRKYFKEKLAGYNELELTFNNTSAEKEWLHKNGEIQIYISDSMRYFGFSRAGRSIYFNKKFRLIGGENLYFIDASDSGCHSFTGNVSGLMALRILIFSGNDLSDMYDTFFDSVLTIEILILSNCNFNSAIESKSGIKGLQKLKHLTTLDLSENSLDVLDPNIFQQNNLTHLVLASNRFRSFPFDIRTTPNLQYLDLRFNALISIQSSVLKEIDHLASGSSGFQLLLKGNILACGCHNINFLTWIHQTETKLDLNRNYSCIDETGSLTYTAAITDMEAFWRACWGSFALSISMILFCLLVIGFVLCFFVTKYKTYIISGLLNMFNETYLKKPSNYEIGVFIGYADRDYQFACHDLRQFIEDTLGLRTFVRDRDLSPTIDLASGITEAIESSWRILLVINETFLTSDDWFLFTCRSAIYSTSPGNPNRVVVLVEERLRHRLPRDLLAGVSEENIIFMSGPELDYLLKESIRTRLVV
ncbi:toll-like receptor 4 [Physella acuta]|uniref:toll-like receptor 4 n=1 Tax=Physella acuta TaxID=109671 RepID=UPI0027DAD1F4|nr:toll-like receptor 4 [Physella acuta]